MKTFETDERPTDDEECELMNCKNQLMNMKFVDWIRLMLWMQFHGYDFRILLAKIFR